MKCLKQPFGIGEKEGTVNTANFVDLVLDKLVLANPSSLEYTLIPVPKECKKVFPGLHLKYILT